MGTEVTDTINYKLLREKLLELEQGFDYTARIKTDPVRFVRRFKFPEDKEAAGIIASALAYGSVKLIGNSLERIFSVLGDSPAAFIDKWLPSEERLFTDFIHRFHNNDDLMTLLWTLGRVRKKYGSVEQLFIKGYDKEQAGRKVEAGMNLTADTFISMAKDSPFKNTRAFSHFFPSPQKGSACKRFSLFLRWINRTDLVDPGGWTKIDKKELISPVDTHMGRIARRLGFTKRKNSSWKMALDVTDAFGKIAPEDPLRFEFLMCHLGISRRCPTRMDVEKCRVCLLRDLCLMVG